MSAHRLLMVDDEPKIGWLRRPRWRKLALSVFRERLRAPRMRRSDR